jgi:tRNA/rRNA methyltransferase
LGADELTGRSSRPGGLRRWYDQSIGTEWRDNLRVVLVETRNPLNIGAAARAMANFGFARLRVVKPYDVAFREARSAVGGARLLAAAEACESVADAVADCRLVVGTTAAGRREMQHTLRRLEHGSRLIRRALEQGPAALLFGSEKSGLANDHLSHCHWLMHIPTGDDVPSMNLGQAVAVCLWELARDPGRAKAADAPGRARTARATKSATGSQNEQVTALLLEALRTSGYVNPVTAASADEKARRLVRRLGIWARDAPVLMGMLRQMLWKMREPRQ